MRMMRHIIIAVLVLTPLFAVRAEAQTGYLQVTGEPGIRIYIDQKFMGVTNDADNGLFIEGLAPGEHQLKAVKKGLEPMELQVVVIEDEAVEVEVALSVPADDTEAEEAPAGEAKPMPKPRTNVGTFMLSSDPVGAKIYIDGDFKGDADIVVDNREAGRHTVIFKMGNQQLKGIYMLRANEVLKLQANFLYEDIVNLTERDRKRPSNRPLPAGR